MFNYPNDAGIHIKHTMNYTISDVLARFKRQQGFESYHPVGWDSFGLPAENYAIKAGVSPQESMAKIIPNYHKQYQAMGWSNDWSKEIATHLPVYYKWTQWIFSEMYRAGLVYQDTRLQWWCDKCQTVLANEQVIDGKCWRHDAATDPEVTQREVKQWFFKITDYADELLEAIDALDWTETVKTAQKNWIGKSVGAELDFLIEGRNQRITVFTTRADTIFSGAFIVLAPEHEMVKDLTTSSQKDAVMDYINQSIRKSDIERQADKEKSGVFTGSYVFNPANGEKMPVWVGDFVLAGYGTGAVFGDIHDERDFEFLKKYGIPAKPTVLPEDEIEAQKVLNKEYPYTGEGVLIDSGEFTGMRSEIARDKIIAWLAGKGLAREKVNYKMRDWSVSRQRYWGAPIPIIYCEKCGPQLVPDADLPVVLPELKDFSPSGDGRSALARATDWVQTKCPKCGGEAERETDTLDTYICSSWYMLRYLDPANSEKIFESPVANKWMPVDFYNGADHATAHMLYARFVTRFFHKKGLVENPEPFKKFLFNGKVTAADGQMFSKSKGNGVDPLEIIPEYGADALRTYLMFAAPLDVWIRWDPQGVPSALRFLNRVWTLVYEFIKTPESAGRNEVVLRATHKTVKKVTFDLENQKYNTAIASMMELVNALNGEKNENGFVDTQAWKFGLESLVQLIAPFAPHMADELWQILGHEDSVQKDHWPIWDEALVREGMATIVIQINGKMRGKVILPTGATEEVVRAAALGDEKIETALGGSEVKRVIFIPDKLLNLVV
jgi:leucyl-tRNA synthetase